MKDAKDLLESNPIEVLTTPSENCPQHKCDGTGWLWFKDWSLRNVPPAERIDAEGNKLKDEWWEKCVCHKQLVKQREINRKLDLSNVPPIFADATVASFEIDKYLIKENREIAALAKRAAANYVNNFKLMQESGKGLYLFSQIKGSGKTRLATSIANALVKLHGVDLAFIKSASLMDQIRNTFDKKSETNKAEVIQTFQQVELLVIDDLALRNPTEFEEEQLFTILDYRLEHKKMTIFTSNVTTDELESVYPGGRVNKRINKMTLEIYMPEESIRDEEAKSEDAELEKILFS